MKIINKKSIYLLVLILSTCVFIGQLFTPVMFILIIISYKNFLPNIFYIACSIIASLFIAQVDIKYSLMFFCYIIVFQISGQFFSRYRDQIVKALLTLAPCFIFVIVFLTNVKLGTWNSILTGSDRMWLTIGDEIDLNPNLLGMLFAVPALLYIKDKKYLLAILFIFFVLLTQSRASILFFVVAILLMRKISLKSVLGSIFILLIVGVVLYYSPIFNRFDDGMSSRDEIFTLAYAEIIKTFPYSMSSASFENFTKIVSPPDNLYLMALMKFGLPGAIFILYTLFLSIRTYIKEQDKYWGSIAIAFFIHGFFEVSFFMTPLFFFLFSISAHRKIKLYNFQ